MTRRLALAAVMVGCGQAVVPSDPLSRDQLVPGANGTLEYRRPDWCAPCAPCDCQCADAIGSAPRTEHVVIGNDRVSFEPDFRATLTTPYWLGRYEVTVRCLELCRIAGTCATRPVRPERADRVQLPQRADYPAIELTLDDARAVCRFFGGRLPTNVQWEFAARGTDGRMFPWGNEPDCTRGNFSVIGDDRLCFGPERPPYPVGAFPSGAGPFGTLDLLGSVFEWVDDVTALPGWYETQRQLNERGIEPIDPVGPRVPAPNVTGVFAHGALRSGDHNGRGSWLISAPLDEPPYNSSLGDVVGARCLWDQRPGRR